MFVYCTYFLILVKEAYGKKCVCLYNFPQAIQCSDEVDKLRSNPRRKVSPLRPFLTLITFSTTTSIRWKIQCAPLATEPGISLIILTPMKILQRNLNRNTFVV